MRVVILVCLLVWTSVCCLLLRECYCRHVKGNSMTAMFNKTSRVTVIDRRVLVGLACAMTRLMTFVMVSLTFRLTC